MREPSRPGAPPIRRGGGTAAGRERPDGPEDEAVDAADEEW
ncbi:hypothetical protein [Streptosporangium sp. NPDC087985]